MASKAGKHNGHRWAINRKSNSISMIYFLPKSNPFFSLKRVQGIPLQIGYPCANALFVAGDVGIMNIRCPALPQPQEHPNAICYFPALHGYILFLFYFPLVYDYHGTFLQCQSFPSCKFRYRRNSFHQQKTHFDNGHFLL